MVTLKLVGQGNGTTTKIPRPNVSGLARRSGLVYSVDGLEIRVDQARREIIFTRVGFRLLVGNPFVTIGFDPAGTITSLETCALHKGLIALLLEPHKKLPLVKYVLQENQAPPPNQALMKHLSSCLRIYIRTQRLNPYPTDITQMEAEAIQLVELPLLRSEQAAFMLRLETTARQGDRNIIPFPS